MTQSSRRLAILAAFVVVAPAVPGSMAIAAADGPRTEFVSGNFKASPVNAWTRTCTGEDGTYSEVRGTFSGSIVTTDPRLTGRLDFTAHALINTATGLGTFEGVFSVTPGGWRPSARGVFFTVVTEGGLNHGFARGTAGGDDDEDSAANLFVRFESVVDVRLNVRGHLGGPGDPRTPAVIQSGRCSGPWTRVP